MMQKLGKSAFIVGFLLPALVLYLIFVCIPLGQTLYYSLHSFRGVSSNLRPVGIQNYQNLLTDPDFLQTLGNVAKFLLFGGSLVFVLGMILAHALQSRTPWARALRSIYMLPHVLSIVAVAVLFRFIYLPNGGLLGGLGFKGPSEGWLGSTQTALYAVALAWVWFAVGFYAMLFAAGLQSIPEEVIEAAELDGASGWSRFKAVTYPLLFGVRKMATIYVVVHVANTFALVNVMTDGGPARQTESLLTLLYEFAFKNSKFGYASSLAMVNLALIIIATLVISFIFRRDPTEGRRTG